MSTEQDRCFMCGGPFKPTEGTTGYGEDAAGYRHCFPCCALLDKALMRREGAITLYWDGKEITNWPGTLRFTPDRSKRSRVKAFGHPIDRVDVWFTFEGTRWHGVNLGDNQICRCRRVK